MCMYWVKSIRFCKLKVSSFFKFSFGSNNGQPQIKISWFKIKWVRLSSHFNFKIEFKSKSWFIIVYSWVINHAIWKSKALVYDLNHRTTLKLFGFKSTVTKALDIKLRSKIPSSCEWVTMNDDYDKRYQRGSSFRFIDYKLNLNIGQKLLKFHFYAWFFVKKTQVKVIFYSKGWNLWSILFLAL